MLGAPSPVPCSLLPYVPLPPLASQAYNHLTPAPLPAAFISKREGSEVVKRARRQLTLGQG